MSSSQNERNLGWGVLENEQGRTRREGRSKLGNHERTYFLNVPKMLFEEGLILFYNNIFTLIS